MNKEFIPYEQALELKELGFNENCFRGYMRQYDEWIITDTIYDGRYEILAPLYQQAFRWFRENGYISQITYNNFHNSYGYQIDGKYHTAEESFLEYEPAEFTCLNKLIEIVKNK
jgi:hypothetical protein